ATVRSDRPSGRNPQRPWNYCNATAYPSVEEKLTPAGRPAAVGRGGASYNRPGAGAARPPSVCRSTPVMDWPPLFGLLLMDFFTGSPYVVELEKDLALHKQLLDVVILRRGKGHFASRLPDGLDDLAAHNLITFKSHRETLDDWALKELTGHYV